MTFRLPNFFIIGAPKCGTTSVFAYLKQHPDVYFPINKEPQFFCNDDLYKKGLQFYEKRFFSDAGDFLCRGDATPHYLYYDKSAQRIRSDLPPDTHRFIVLLRDPVARAYSHYWNMVQEGYETLSFEQALEAEPERLRDSDLATRGTLTAHYVAAGLYARQIERWLQVFDNQCFLFLLYEDLVNNPQGIMAQIYDFLDIRPREVSLSEIHNPSSQARSVRLQRWIRRPNRLRSLIMGVVPYRLRYAVTSHVLSLNKKAAAYPPVDAALAERLRSQFAEDIIRLERMIGKDLAPWKTIQPRNC